MNLTRHQSIDRSLARPLRGEAEPWQYVGASLTPRVSFDPYARKVSSRRSSLKVNAAGWRILLNVLRIR